ncbi:hypothetical protein [Vreelandella titanicae]|uniref:hypothetical protein n=1 Tax=Vreelandella titanicae TaxID=664683 RepID=UPI0015934D24|nr:hypothetical protein [Halomonas titanicae]NVE91559.1 hypothetical protein [Halomonas titanicae]|tara:strand:- start:2640 stop:3023 length:384 start_codon:yes stop_codon:yes gene_type:complete
MLSMLGKLIPTWVWAAVLGIAVVGGLAWWVLADREQLTTERDAAKAEVETLTVSRDHWHQRAMSVTEQLGDTRQRYREAEQAVRALQAELIEQSAGYKSLRQRIEDAPESDDGPVAPVLRNALESLP